MTWLQFAYGHDHIEVEAFGLSNVIMWLTKKFEINQLDCSIQELVKQSPNSDCVPGH
jgi:hypothetical protein